MNDRNSRVSVAEVAEQLHVHPSRVRALIAHDELDAQKISGRWVVDQASVDRWRTLQKSDGRPYDKANSWALISLAEGLRVDWVGPSELSRLRRRLRTDGLVHLAPRLRRRATTLRMHGHPSAIRRLADDPAAIEAGARLAHRCGLGIQPSDDVEVYVSASDAGDLIDRYLLAPSTRPNAILHVVDDDAGFSWIRSVGGVVAALDLIESGDARSHREGRRFLAAADAAISAQHQVKAR